MMAVVLGGGCRVDEDAFEERVFHCDTSAPDPLCGEDADGEAMTCFPASQLDGSDFCAKSCGEPMSLAAEDAVCVQGGAKLRACRPSDTTTPGGPCGRTDLGFDYPLPRVAPWLDREHWNPATPQQLSGHRDAPELQLRLAGERDAVRHERLLRLGRGHVWRPHDPG